MKIISVFIFCFLWFGNCSFSQAWIAVSGPLERDTIKAVKQGIFTVKGVVTIAGKPAKGVNVALDASYFDTKHKGIVSDRRKFLTLLDGSYQIKVRNNNFYLKEHYSYFWNMQGYHWKRLVAIVNMPRGTKGYEFILDLPIEMVPLTEPDTNQCGFIIWSKEKNNFVVAWRACSPNDPCIVGEQPWPKMDEKTTLKNIFFEPNKSQIVGDSYVELNRLVDFLLENKNTTIEINGWVDTIGNEEKNKQLATARAKSVADYLILKGVDKARVSHVSYSSAILDKNETKVSKKKGGQVEFIIKDK